MKKIEINVVQGDQILKKFYIEEKTFETDNGKINALTYRCETRGMTGFSSGYISGAVIMNEKGEPLGAFTRPLTEVVEGEKFQVQFGANPPFDCICLGTKDVAPPPKPLPIPTYTPRNVKTREEIEWELQQLPKIPVGR